MRGITPARLGILVAVCMILAARPAFWNFEADRALQHFQRWLFFLERYFVFALPMLILVVKTEIRTSGSRPVVRIMSLAGAVLLGAACYSNVVWVLSFLASDAAGVWQWQAAFFVRALAMGGLLTAILYIAQREKEAQRELHRLRLAHLELEQQATESRLRLLQAQVEPHFLFNSLASIKRLYEKEPGRGRAMLRNLDDYVNVATARAGRGVAPLGGEIALAESFLAIFQVRMGDRLRVRIDIPGRLEAALVPSLMVGTLVENAIKHGISPRASGGTVSLSARLAGEMIEIDVRDDGVGFRARSGRGVGLANIRARLESLFAGAGGLELTANEEGGMTATLRLPFHFAPGAAGA